MAYNHGREDRKWRIWKEAEEKLLREGGVDEATIEQIRMADRADFNSNRRFYRWTNDVEQTVGRSCFRHQGIIGNRLRDGVGGPAVPESADEIIGGFHACPFA